MSRGLGKLQAEILNTLEEAKQEIFDYRGSCRQENRRNYNDWKWDKPGWVRCRNRKVLLADHVYDLRASMEHIATKMNCRSGAGYINFMGVEIYRRGQISDQFKAAFSRAVKGLIARGLIKPLGMVPIKDYVRTPRDEWDYSSPVMYLKDGLFLSVSKRQNRFIVKC